jgi:hypothetical protein
MRLPFLQLESDIISHGAAEVSNLAGCSIPEALGHIALVRAWAVSHAADEAPPDGWVEGDAAGRRIEAAAHWKGEKGALLQALIDAGHVRPEADGHRVLRLEPYVKAWERSELARWRRERTNYPHLYQTEDVPEPVPVPRFAIRLKTPEERAQAEAEHARLMEANRLRAERERADREAMKAAKRAAARVYFIQQDGGDRLVKIGTTTRPVEVRLKELQAGQPHPLVILAHAPGGRYDEGRLHARFGPHRVTGEWFRPDVTLLGYAATVGKAGVL